MTDDPIRAHLQTATEALRVVSHDNTKPEDPAALSARVGDLEDLLRKLHQVTERLSGEAKELVDRQDLYTTHPDRPASVVIDELVDLLDLVPSSIEIARHDADLAHNRAASIGVLDVQHP